MGKHQEASQQCKNFKNADADLFNGEGHLARVPCVNKPGVPFLAVLSISVTLCRGHVTTCSLREDVIPVGVRPYCGATRSGEPDAFQLGQKNSDPGNAVGKKLEETEEIIV